MIDVTRTSNYKLERDADNLTVHIHCVPSLPPLRVSGATLHVQQAIDLGITGPSEGFDLGVGLEIEVLVERTSGADEWSEPSLDNLT